MIIKRPIIVFAVVGLFFSSAFASAEGRAHELYIKYCAECHHKDRIGLTAPPLIPSLLSRSVRDRVEEVIRHGLPATRMPAFPKLTDEEISLLTAYIKVPADPSTLVWTIDDVRNSRKCEDISSAPIQITPDQLDEVLLVMERGTHSLAVLHGNELKPLGKFFVGAVHGGPKYSYSLKQIYAVARDGRTTWYDLMRLKTACTLKAGISTRSIALTRDDRYVAVANYLPKNIVFFNSSLEAIHTIALPEKAGGFYSAPKGEGFILSFRELPELWIIKPDENYAIEKITIPDAFEDLSISAGGEYLLGTKRGSGRLHIFDYDKRKIVATLPTSGLPHLASASFWRHGKELYAGINHIKAPYATILSLTERKEVAKIPLPGAGFFVRTHRATSYLWIDTETDTIALIDKNDYHKVKYLKPHPGRKAMHVEFTTDGSRALVTIPGTNGEVVVYDTATLEKIATMPYNRPVGKYSAINKTYPERSIGRLSDSANDNGDVALGLDVFEHYCMGCHHQTYEAFGKSFQEIAGTRTEEEIRQQILDPGSSVDQLGYKRSSMSKIKLTDDQLDAIVAYILSFKQEQ